MAKQDELMTAVEQTFDGYGDASKAGITGASLTPGPSKKPIDTGCFDDKCSPTRHELARKYTSMLKLESGNWLLIDEDTGITNTVSEAKLLDKVGVELFIVDHEGKRAKDASERKRKRKLEVGRQRLEEQVAQTAAMGEWRQTEETLLLEYCHERTTTGGIRGGAYTKLTEHFDYPPTYVAPGGMVVCVVPGTDHSTWRALQQVVLDAMAEPIQISVELQEMKADERKNNKKARVAGEGSKKLGDVTCTYNGLFLGGGLPEEIEAAADRAKEEARKKALRAEDAEVLRKVR
jgi:hypothetical protein